MNLGLKGRVALVTGASKGIGKAIARGLADEGVSLVLLARTADALEAAAAEIRAATGVRVIAVPTDLRDATATKAAAARAATEFGTVHILVNNAGGPIKRPERQITWPDADWLEATFRIANFEGAVVDVLSLGPHIHVLEPAELRDEVADRIRRAARLYSER